MSSASPAPADAAAASSAVAGKKAGRRRARGAASVKPRSFHVYVEDMLKRSPRLHKIQTVNGASSAFSSASLQLLSNLVIRRADAVRKHRNHAGFQIKDTETAFRSFFAHATPATRAKLETIIAAANAAAAAVVASREKKPSDAGSGVAPIEEDDEE